ncbi:Cof-type HAD-IIB family hydrolase [Wukongibacter baidiensis]|uniref:Cof-type HAD-IIB family hydrolase n=1 Tax=Wukongibacter baidiensis TaxID=1723361 RepID=UPI003D7FD2A3
MKYKAVISDLDGTLLNSNHKVSDYSKKVIKEIVNKGVKFFIATGRHHMDAEHIRRNLELDTILITSNGSRVHDVGRKELFAQDIDAKTVRDILNIEVDKEIYANIYQGDRWFVEIENEKFKEFHKESGFTYEVMDFKALEEYSSSKVFFICKDHEKLVMLKEKIEDMIPEKINITFSTPHCLEIMASGISKGAALESVLQQYDIGLDEVIAFGDGLNDFEMLQLVGKGIIMGNAHDELKKALPQNEVIQSNDEDGVVKYLEKLFL